MPYDQLKEMDDVNPEFPRTDVSLVIGANDVTNPAAKNTPVLADLRHADPRGQRQPLGDRDQALDEPRLRRHRKRALLRARDLDAVRRREVGGRRHHRRARAASEAGYVPAWSRRHGCPGVGTCAGPRSRTSCGAYGDGRMRPSADGACAVPDHARSRGLVALRLDVVPVGVQHDGCVVVGVRQFSRGPGAPLSMPPAASAAARNASTAARSGRSATRSAASPRRAGALRAARGTACRRRRSPRWSPSNSAHLFRRRAARGPCRS